jgi:hypothetical protein
MDHRCIAWSQFGKVYASALGQFAEFTAKLAKENPVAAEIIPSSEIDKFHEIIKGGDISRSQAETIWRRLTSEQKRTFEQKPPAKKPYVKSPRRTIKQEIIPKKRSSKEKVEDEVADFLQDEEDEEDELEETSESSESSDAPAVKKKARKVIRSDSEEDEEHRSAKSSKHSLAAKFTWK